MPQVKKNDKVVQIVAIQRLQAHSFYLARDCLYSIK